MTLVDDLGYEKRTSIMLEKCRDLVSTLFPKYRRMEQRRDLAELARRAGIEIKTFATNEFSGRFENAPSARPSISLSTNTTGVRRRFTLAHEIGHWMLRTAQQAQGLKIIDWGSLSLSEEETLARLLASELLMPIDSIRNTWKASEGFRLKTVQKIAKDFDVSFQAAVRRIAEISETPLLYLSVIPQTFRDHGSAALIDESLFVWPARGVDDDRKGCRFVRKYSFSEIGAEKRSLLGLHTAFGRVLCTFDVQHRTHPIPSLVLLANITAANVKTF